MNLQTEPYTIQATRWPATGRHILANYDAGSIVVYQAYRPAIAAHALSAKAFGGDFSYARMSWIKPNFLWMMYRSGWATKENQKFVLALRLSRPFFERLLEQAVPSSFDGEYFASHEEWKSAVASSEVRLQWDPDHDPHGKPVERRAIQLGLRGDTLEKFGKRELLDVIDMTAFVSAQRSILASGNLSAMMLPSERVYHPQNPDLVRRHKLGAAG
jgi:Domain of unknown function (DUF4291)